MPRHALGAYDLRYNAEQPARIVHGVLRLADTEQVWAAALAGTSAVSLRADPALPLQTLAITGVLAPPLASRFNLGERNTLLWDGIATFDVAQEGTVSIENLITTYQLNSFGQPDDRYLEIETLFTLMYVLRDMADLVTLKYARVMLAANGTRFAPGAGVVTPSMIQADLIAEFQALEYAGYVQDSTDFANSLIVQQNSTKGAFGVMRKGFYVLLLYLAWKGPGGEHGWFEPIRKFFIG